MDSSQILCSDSNGCAYGADFLKLARELKIPEYLLKSALNDAADVMREWSPITRPANKKALRGVATLLAKAIEQLSETGVRERLTVAVSEKPEEPDSNEYAGYFAWLAAHRRVKQAIEGARDLLEIVKRGETINFRSGRPQYEHWKFAIKFLLEYWIEDLQREVTISGHPDDGRNVKPSPALQFVYQSMRLIGENITEQACRTIMQNLKEEGYTLEVDFNEW